MFAGIAKLLLIITIIGFIGRFEDGPLKFLCVVIIPIILAFLFSINWGIFSFGGLILLCMGTPLPNEVFNACGLRRKFGILFDIIGIFLILLGILRGIFF